MAHCSRVYITIITINLLVDSMRFDENETSLAPEAFPWLSLPTTEVCGTQQQQSAVLEAEAGSAEASPALVYNEHGWKLRNAARENDTGAVSAALQGLKGEELCNTLKDKSKQDLGSSRNRPRAHGTSHRRGGWPRRCGGGACGGRSASPASAGSVRRRA
eukprot:TRINITY_DN18876_c0_g1_i1.p1 TRINITY_DN18876_c0_g1~~TRINITY_DN18876_c0_g1_i1.p1  ORF type:complete len:173 (+),score=17.54 TRINITY_DN18876_c0_g1_i1:40-519(+)